MGKKPVINLRVYRGKEMNYDANGNVKNENQSVKIVYNTIDWATFMKYLPFNGFCKVEVESAIVYDGEAEPYKDIEAIREEVQKAFNPEKEVELTEDQKRIAELEAKLDKLIEPKKEKKAKEPKVDKDELAKVRAEYETVLGKKAFHKWTVEQLREKIDNA